MTALVPIIGALLAGGDDVLVASGPEAAPIIEKSGARFASAGRSQAHWMERLAARMRGNPGDGLAPERILHYSSLEPSPRWVLASPARAALWIVATRAKSFVSAYRSVRGRTVNPARTPNASLV